MVKKAVALANNPNCNILGRRMLMRTGRVLLLLCLLLLLHHSTLHAQTDTSISLTGQLVDTVTNEAINQASISVQPASDSSVHTFSLSNDKGFFTISNLASGRYQLIITYPGYRTYTTSLSLLRSRPLENLGIIYMEKSSILLPEIVVEVPPVQVKNDTVQYRASAFATRPNATAEELLKKLPGIQVDREGTIKAAGEEVQKIYVDGREFFGNDPKIATRNLTADMIESVQVYTDKSDAAKFTHMDDGTRIKTINIKLKKDRQQGYFGRLAAGYGTQHKTENAGSYNQFGGNNRLSLVGGYNNINSSDFQQAGNGNFLSPAGIGSSSSAGINYVTKFGNKLKISGSYSHSHAKNESHHTSTIRSFFPNDSATMSYTGGTAINDRDQHRFNLRLEYELDSFNSVLITSALQAAISAGNTTDSATVAGANDRANSIYNHRTTFNQINTGGTSINNGLLYRRRFSKWGRTLTIGYNQSLYHNNSHAINRSIIDFYTDPTFPGSQLRHIKNETANSQSANDISVAYTEPVGKHQVVEVDYAYHYNNANLDRKAFNYNPLTAAYDSADEQLTNLFENKLQSHKYGVHFKWQTDHSGLQIGGAVQTALQQNNSDQRKGNDSLLSQQMVNFFPAISYSYNFNKHTSFRINYYGRNRQPTIMQLQQTPDVTNPLQIRTGNPLLHQEFIHDVNIGYNTFDPNRFGFFNMNINLGMTANKIANSLDTVGHSLLNAAGDKSVQLIKPVNVNGAFNGTSSLTYGRPFRKGHSSNFSMTQSVFYNRDVNVIYKEKNRTDQVTISHTATVSLAIKEKVEMGLRAAIDYNHVKYSIQRGRNTNYFSHQYAADLHYYITPSLVINTDGQYIANTGFTAGADRAFLLWNAGLQYQFLKKKNAEIQWKVYDLLNNAKSMDRTIGENYIRDSRATVMRRYFMLMFTYKFNGTIHGH